jgi:2-keto-3-deoxy-L-rhamnonate aldolase RhmA
LNGLLKNRLKARELTVGSWITLGHASIAEIMARAGFDWLVVDLEHSVIAIDTAADMIRVIDLCGVVPLVRLTSNHSDQIKRVMDAGAHGIIVPMVNTAEEARRAVAAVRYAPAGNRGVGLARAQGYGARFQEYLSWQRESAIVVVMVEHKDAIGNLRDILAVPGVDAFFIGPYDLSCSLGIPGQFEHPDFLAAMGETRRIGAEVGAVSGLHVVEPDLERMRASVAEGFRFIAYGVDIRILDIGARQGANFAKGLRA